MLMGHFSKDRPEGLLYTTAWHSSIASMVLTASSPPDCVLCAGLFFSSAANQDVVIWSAQILQALCSASVVILPTTLFLLTSCFKYQTCAPRDGLCCFAGYLDTVACLATRPSSGSHARAARFRPSPRY
jgi:hypothetical protein